MRRELPELSHADGETQLETVEDNAEWESAAEACDDLQFGGDAWKTDGTGVK